MPENQVISQFVIKYLADVSDIKKQLGSIDATNKEIEKSAKHTSDQINNVSDSVGVLSSGLQTAISIIASAGLTSFAKRLAMAAGRADELQKVLYMAGKNAGYSREALDGYEASLVRTGIATTQARSSLAKMIQANIDLAKSTTLARMAQDLAVISGWNSSETMERLIINIQQADTMGLRFMGIILNQVEAMNKYKKAMGITGRELSRIERSQAIFNEVVVQGAKFTGAYEESLKSWTKTVRSTERYVSEMQRRLGEGMQEPLLHFERSYQGLLKLITNLGPEIHKTLGFFAGYTALIATIGSIALGFQFIKKQIVGVGLEADVAAAKMAKMKAMVGKVVGAVLILSATDIGRDLMTEMITGVEKGINLLGDLTKKTGEVSTEMDKAKHASGAFMDSLTVGFAMVLMKINPVVGAIAAVAAGIFSYTSKIRKEIREIYDLSVAKEFGMARPETVKATEDQLKQIEDRIEASKELISMNAWVILKEREGISEKEKSILIQEKEAIAKKAGIDLLNLEGISMGDVTTHIQQNIEALKEHTVGLEKYQKKQKAKIEDDKKAVRQMGILKEAGIELDKELSAVSFLPTEVKQREALKKLAETYKEMELSARNSSEVGSKALAESLSHARRKVIGASKNIGAIWEKITKEMTSDLGKTVFTQLDKLDKKIATLREKEKKGAAEQALLLKYLQDREALMGKIIKLHGKDESAIIKKATSEYLKAQQEKLEATKDEINKSTTELNSLYAQLGKETNILKQSRIEEQIKEISDNIIEFYSKVNEGAEESTKGLDVYLEAFSVRGRRIIQEAYNIQRKNIEENIVLEKDRNARIEQLDRERADKNKRLANELERYKEKIYRESLRIYKSSLDSMVSEHKGTIDRLKTLENQRVEVIQKTEERIRSITQTTEEKIRDIRRKGMSGVEAYRDIQKEAVRLFKEAEFIRVTRQTGRFAEAEENIKKAMSLVGRLTTGVKATEEDKKRYEEEKKKTFFARKPLEITEKEATETSIKLLRRLSQEQKLMTKTQGALTTGQIDKQKESIQSYQENLKKSIEESFIHIKDLENKLLSVSKTTVEIKVQDDQAQKSLTGILDKVREIKREASSIVAKSIFKEGVGGLLEKLKSNITKEELDRREIEKLMRKPVIDKTSVAPAPEGGKEFVEKIGDSFLDLMSKVTVPTNISALNVVGGRATNKVTTDSEGKQVTDNRKITYNFHYNNGNIKGDKLQVTPNIKKIMKEFDTELQKQIDRDK